MVSMFRDKVVINRKVDTKERESCREQYAKWDKPIAGIVGVITFLTIVGCLIYDIYQQKATKETDNASRNMKNSDNFCTRTGCQILCEGMADTVDIEELVASVSSSCQASPGRNSKRATTRISSLLVVALLLLRLEDAPCNRVRNVDNFIVDNVIVTDVVSSRKCKNHKSNYQISVNYSYTSIRKGEIQQLHIKGSVLKNNKLPSNWLENLGKAVITLKFTNVNLAIIEDGALSSSTFRKTQGLILADTNTYYLGKNALEGLSTLNYFSLEFYTPSYCAFEYGFLQHVKYIQTLQVNQCFLTSETIRNLTNSNVILGNLQKIDFSYSLADHLQGNVFNKAHNVKSIYLHGLRLTSVDVNVFRGLTSLSLLHMNDNDLVTLEEGIFDDMVKGTDTHIHIQDNHWRCDCDLEWLQRMYIDYDYIVDNPGPMCHFNEMILPFENIEFCQTTSTDFPITTTTEMSNDNITSSTATPTTTQLTSSSSSTETSPNTTVTTPITTPISTTTLPSTTTTPDGRYRFITCRDWKTSPIVLLEPYTKELVYTHELRLQEETVRFNFYEINEVPVRIAIDIETNVDMCAYHLLWFNSRNTSDTGCTTNLETSIVIDQMRRNNTYTICVMTGEDIVVTPYDCLGLRVRVEYPERAWIRNKSKTMIIAISISLLILAILLSTLLMYLCVRFNPRMIKGNKRVVIIEKASREPAVRPAEEYERPAYFTPSIASYITSQSSYLAPGNRYSRIKDRFGNYGLGNVQESSIYNGEVSYVRPKAPSADQLSSWRSQNFRDRFSDENLGSSNNIYEQPIPPPLPPPNQKKVIIEENLYTCV